MEGSYDPVYSGPSTPMSPSAPSGANQYKANVNRTKTRKWVEAKTVDYGGDDWGGDYDDEPEEAEQEAQPPPKPHGPRPSATFSNSQPPSPAGPRPLQTAGLAPRAASPAVSSSSGIRTPLGAPALHIQTQQHPASQPTAADTGSPWRQGPPSRGSTPGIDRPREISPHAVGVPSSATASSVYSAVAEFGQLYGDRGASPGPFQGPRPRRMSPGPQSASSSVPPRFPGRKSSLGQHDAPGDNIMSPVYGDNNRQLGSRPGSSHTYAAPIMSSNKPWMVEGTVGGPRSSSPSGSVRSPTATGKPLPFVRPADIYKKLGEEKEKIRRSMDSGRPSMDSLGLGPGSDTASDLRTQTPTGTSRNKPQAQEQGQVRPDSDVISPGLTRVTTDVPLTEEVQVDSSGRKGTTLGRDDDDSIAPRSGRTGLPTVAERKSEYGIEGLIASYEARGGTSGGTSGPDGSPLAPTAESASVDASGKGVPAVPSLLSRVPPGSDSGEEQGDHLKEAPQLEKKEGAAQDKAVGSGRSQRDDVKGAQKTEERVEAQKELSGEELRRLSTSPKLPELGRLSVFGFDLFSSSTSADPQTSSASSHNPTSSPPPPVPTIPFAHTIVSPTSPLSTVIESPSSSLASPVPARHDLLDQPTQEEEQTSGPHGNERTRLPEASNTLPGQDSSSPTASASVSVPEQPGVRQSDSSPEQHDHQSGDSNSNSVPDTARQGAAAELAQRPQSATKSIPDLHATSRFASSKSVSEHQPSVDKALPALPSEASVVTPDPQASQLVISSPMPFVPDDRGSSEGETPNASSSANPKLAVHPLLAQESEKVKSIPVPVSISSSSHATSASMASPVQATKLTLGDNQVFPLPDIPGPLVTDYDSYLGSSASDNAAGRSPQSDDSDRRDEDGSKPHSPKEQVAEGTAAGSASTPAVAAPLKPDTAPPLPPAELNRGETYVTAIESPSLLTPSGSPTKSDKLSAEILRSLSPGAPDAVAAPESDTENRPSDDPSAARESSFLPDLYDDYWSFGGTGSAEDNKEMPPVSTNAPSDAMPAALKVQTDDTRPRSLVGANDETTRIQSPLPSQAEATPRSSVDVYKVDVQAVPVELHRPVLANRFSWERDGLEGAKVDIQAEPKSLAIKELPLSNDRAVSDDAPTVAKSSELTVKPSRTPSPTPAHESQAVASSSPSPGSPVQSSGTVIDTKPSATVPGSVPYHRDVHPGPLSSNPVLSWQEIMAVSSPTDRIAELNKARSHYAAAETGLFTIIEDLATRHPDVAESHGAGALSSAAYTYDTPIAQGGSGLLSPTALGTSPAAGNRQHLMQTTGQIGTKGKELFATAGKASKGFFSTLKAKSKKVAN